jgi:hypothetical protein
MDAIPTPEQPRRIIAHPGAGHGFLFAADGAWWLEHCQDGDWGRCQVGGPQTSLWQARQACVKHLRRRPHRWDAPEVLRGTVHA